MTNNSNGRKRKVLTFEGSNGKTYKVKERTMSQIYKVLDSYMDYAWWEKYEYIPGTQEISPMNGNIYAKFKVKGTNSIQTFYIADYNDYIKEIDFNA